MVIEKTNSLKRSLGTLWATFHFFSELLSVNIPQSIKQLLQIDLQQYGFSFSSLDHQVKLLDFPNFTVSELHSFPTIWHHHPNSNMYLTYNIKVYDIHQQQTIKWTIVYPTETTRE